MRAIRLPLLCAFAGGCLSNALLFCLWRNPESAGSSAVKQPQRSHSVVELATAATTASNIQRPSERVAANAAEDADGAATEPARTEPAQDKSEGPPPTGSAVSDVLTRLEAAYRERVTARAPAQPPPAPEGATEATRTINGIAAPEPARGAAPQSGVDVPTAPVGGAIEARGVAPTAVGSAASAPAAVGPQVAAEPAFAAEDAAAPSQPPAQIHYGDVNQNTYITNVREGDVYLIQLQQQLAVLQYMQLLGASSSLAGPGRHGRGAMPQRAAFPSGITNPDNPWGFQFAPPHLVR